MSNPWKVEIKDFQSLKQVKLDLVDGVNIITGKTNQGKSAVIRAIDAALFNMGDDSMVRGGRRYSGISIDNGTHRMVFCRDSHGKNEKTAYQFDGGTVQKKVGRSQLPEVQQFFNIRDVRMQNNTKMKLNFWYQNDKPFLMDKTSGQLYEFLSLSSCDKYTKVLKKMIVDLKVQEADINNITTEIDTLKSINNKKTDFINKNIGFDDLYVEIVTADQEKRALDGINTILTRINTLREKAKKSGDNLRIVSDKLKGIPMDIISEEYSLVDTENKTIQNVSKGLSRVESLKGTMSRTSDRLDSIKTRYTQSSKIEIGLKKGLDILLEDTDGISKVHKIVSDCTSYSKRMMVISSKISSNDDKMIDGLSDIENSVEFLELKYRELGVLKTCILKTKELESKKSFKLDELNDTVKKVENTDNQLQELKDVAGYCPYCGTVFDKHSGQCVG